MPCPCTDQVNVSIVVMSIIKNDETASHLLQSFILGYFNGTTNPIGMLISKRRLALSKIEEIGGLDKCFAP